MFKERMYTILMTVMVYTIRTYQVQSLRQCFFIIFQQDILSLDRPKVAFRKFKATTNEFLTKESFVSLPLQSRTSRKGSICSSIVARAACLYYYFCVLEQILLQQLFYPKLWIYLGLTIKRQVLIRYTINVCSFLYPKTILKWMKYILLPS